jgi:hypothetical protein
MSGNNENIFDRKGGNRIDVRGTRFPPNEDGNEVLNSDRMANNIDAELEADELNIAGEIDEPQVN